MHRHRSTDPAQCRMQKSEAASRGQSLLWFLKVNRKWGNITSASIGHTWILWLPNNECGVTLFLMSIYVVPFKLTLKSLWWSTVKLMIPMTRPSYDYRVILLYPQVARSVVTLVDRLHVCLFSPETDRIYPSSNYSQLQQIDLTTCR